MVGPRGIVPGLIVINRPKPGKINRFRAERTRVTYFEQLDRGRMSPFVIDVRNADDPRDVVHRAVQALAEGKLVGLPTESVYGLAARALDARAVQRLVAVKRRKTGHPISLAIRSLEEALDYAPDMSPLARRLARRC